MVNMKRKKMVWIGVITLVCFTVLGVYYYYSKIKMEGITVQTVTVAKGEIKQYLEDTAEVKTKEEKTVYVEGVGRITSISFDVGDSVNKGDVMLTLDKSELEFQLRDANAKIDAAKEQIKGAELVNYEDKINIARASVEQAQVVCDSAERDYENAKKLYEADVISNAEYIKTEYSYKTAKATLDSANAQLADIERGTPDYLKNTYISQLKQALIVRDNILKNIDKQKVKAPLTGIVLKKDVEDNSPVIAGTAAFVIGNVKKLELEADILADDCSKVKIDDEVEISGKPLGNAVLKGKVIKIAPAAKTITSTLGVEQKRVPVTIGLENSNGALKPGYTVDIRVITAVKKEVLTVSDGSVFDYKGNTCVLTVENGKTVLKHIKTGLENDQLIEVLEGLKGGEKILVKLDNTIKEGMKVRADQSK